MRITEYSEDSTLNVAVLGVGQFLSWLRDPKGANGFYTQKYNPQLPPRPECEAVSFSTCPSLNLGTLEFSNVLMLWSAFLWPDIRGTFLLSGEEIPSLHMSHWAYIIMKWLWNGQEFCWILRCVCVWASLLGSLWPLCKQLQCKLFIKYWNTYVFLEQHFIYVSIFLNSEICFFFTPWDIPRNLFAALKFQI